ncbi:hypothetical protein PO124_15380 [Bacillus licheniformis]|nr:hypothetical protein [Bacillus licheniformis]
MSQVEFEGVSKRIKADQLSKISHFKLPQVQFWAARAKRRWQDNTYQMIVGMAKPTSGDIRIDGYSVKAITRKRQPESVLLLKPILYEHLTGYQTLNISADSTATCQRSA